MPDACVVVDASPLIFLCNANRLELLHTLGASRITVPEPVFDEVIAGRTHRSSDARGLRRNMAREAPGGSDSGISRCVGDRKGRILRDRSGSA